MYRGHHTRSRCARLRADRAAAAKAIQGAYRSHSLRREVAVRQRRRKVEHTAATRIQAIERGRQCRLQEDHVELTFKELSFKSIDQAAFKKDLFACLAQGGVPPAALQRFRVVLREGSVIAQVRGEILAVSELKVSLQQGPALELLGCEAAVTSWGLPPEEAARLLRKLGLEVPIRPVVEEASDAADSPVDDVDDHLDAAVAAALPALLRPAPSAASASSVAAAEVKSEGGSDGPQGFPAAGGEQSTACSPDLEVPSEASLVCQAEAAGAARRIVLDAALVDQSSVAADSVWEERSAATLHTDYRYGLEAARQRAGSWDATLVAASSTSGPRGWAHVVFGGLDLDRAPPALAPPRDATPVSGSDPTLVLDFHSELLPRAEDLKAHGCEDDDVENPLCVGATTHEDREPKVEAFSCIPDEIDPPAVADAILEGPAADEEDRDLKLGVCIPDEVSDLPAVTDADWEGLAHLEEEEEPKVEDCPDIPDDLGDPPAPADAVPEALAADEDQELKLGVCIPDEVSDLPAIVDDLSEGLAPPEEEREPKAEIRPCIPDDLGDPPPAADALPDGPAADEDQELKQGVFPCLPDDLGDEPVAAGALLEGPTADAEDRDLKLEVYPFVPDDVGSEVGLADATCTGPAADEQDEDREAEAVARRIVDASLRPYSAATSEVLADGSSACGGRAMEQALAAARHATEGALRLGSHSSLASSRPSAGSGDASAAPPGGDAGQAAVDAALLAQALAAARHATEGALLLDSHSSLASSRPSASSGDARAAPPSCDAGQAAVDAVLLAQALAAARHATEGALLLDSHSSSSRGGAGQAAVDAALLAQALHDCPTGSCGRKAASSIATGESVRDLAADNVDIALSAARHVLAARVGPSMCSADEASELSAAGSREEALGDSRPSSVAAAAAEAAAAHLLDGDAWGAAGKIRRTVPGARSSASAVTASEAARADDVKHGKALWLEPAEILSDGALEAISKAAPRGTTPELLSEASGPDGLHLDSMLQAGTDRLHLWWPAAGSEKVEIASSGSQADAGAAAVITGLQPFACSSPGSRAGVHLAAETVDSLPVAVDEILHHWPSGRSSPITCDGNLSERSWEAAASPA